MITRPLQIFPHVHRARSSRALSRRALAKEGPYLTHNPKQESDEAKKRKRIIYESRMAQNGRPDTAPVKHDFLELELSDDAHTGAETATPSAEASAPDSDVEYETYIPRPRRMTWCEWIFDLTWYCFIRRPNESYPGCFSSRIVITLVCLAMTVPIWLSVLLVLLPASKDEDGDWCGCILGPSAQTYNSNTETDAADCLPMLNGSIVLNPNCYWRNDATFCQAAQAWPYPITRPCQELSGT